MTAQLALVVDDEPDVLEGLQKCLSRAGYEVKTAINGQEALQRIQEKRPSFIILDILLPDINGFEICQRLKEAPETKDITIILSTARHVDRNEPWLIGTHADGYLEKPYTPEDLLETVKKVVR